MKYLMFIKHTLNLFLLVLTAKFELAIFELKFLLLRAKRHFIILYKRRRFAKILRNNSDIYE